MKIVADAGWRGQDFYLEMPFQDFFLEDGQLQVRQPVADAAVNAGTVA